MKIAAQTSVKAGSCRTCSSSSGGGGGGGGGSGSGSSSSSSSSISSSLFSDHTQYNKEYTYIIMKSM